MEEETIETTEVKEFKLPKKKVTVRLVDRSRGMKHEKGHAMYNMPSGVTFELCPKHLKGTRVIDCPLTREEIMFFENKSKSGMAFEVGDLSVDQPKASNFWYARRSKVTLSNRPMVLDLSKATDYITYKILLSNSDMVAPSAKEEFSKKSYVFVITSDEEEQVTILSKGDKNKRAWRLATKMEDSREKMIDFLTVIGKRPSDNSKLEFLRAEIDKQIDTNINQFLETLEDERYETRVLLMKSLTIKSVLRDGNKYFLPGGDELCFKGEVNNLTNTLKFLDADENQDIRLILSAKLIKKD
jgi:hypothetical protein